jgi:hypothetical protein
MTTGGSISGIMVTEETRQEGNTTAKALINGVQSSQMEYRNTKENTAKSIDANSKNGVGS